MNSDRNKKHIIKIESKVKTFLIAILALSLLEGYHINDDKKQVALGKSSDTSAITRVIDASNVFRSFPDLVGYRNTSIQKTPPPILGRISEDILGKPRITRCWLNLDEMWDYRTRKFNFNFIIGIDKYKNISEKYRESWNWEENTDIPYEQYLKAFSKHSDAIMLDIRRYERDILDKRLPISMKDWKFIFKTGLKHYKSLFPNIRYVEVCNEYSGKSFMNATDEEYYQFYRQGYEAVNEVNRELGLRGKNRILVGGPVVTGDILKKIDHFLQFYSEDVSKEKRLDFISWHDYHKKIKETSYRERDLIALLNKYNINEDIPLFMTEHDPYHFSEDKLGYHFLNAAYLPKSLYFASLYSPKVKIFPWVLYHNKNIQTKFMWFGGPNDVNTKENKIRMFPLGCSMKFLNMLDGKEIRIDNSIDKEDLVLASCKKNRLTVEAINYSNERSVSLQITNISQVFSGLKNGELMVQTYLIDSTHSNYLTNKNYQDGLEMIEDSIIEIKDNKLTLNRKGLEKNGLTLWVIRRRQ